VDAQRFIDGKYRFQVSALDGFVWRLDPDMTSLSDFHLSAEARRVSGPIDAPYGVSFRDDDSNYYYFKISDDGNFRVALYYNGKWETVISWTTTSTIHPGEANRLAVRGEGSHLTFYINGAQVGEADDSRVGAGTAGVALELNDPGDEAIFEFDNFEVRAP